jgi:hypothetical protein
MCVDMSFFLISIYKNIDFFLFFFSGCAINVAAQVVSVDGAAGSYGTCIEKRIYIKFNGSKDEQIVSSSKLP